MSTTQRGLRRLVNIHEGDRVDIYALLSAESSLNRPGAAARLALSRRTPQVECPRYLVALDRALWEQYPPFSTELYGDMFREACTGGQWLAMSLMTNAEGQGESARCLWSMAACSDEGEEQRLLKRHACDESVHALAYLELLDLSFPGSIDPSFRAELDRLSPRYSLEQEVVALEGSSYARKPSIDDYVQINIAEIRTIIHHLMRSEAVNEHCPVQNRSRARRIMDSLLNDELNHVAYTAVLLERKADLAGSREFEELFCRGVRVFNQMTSEEPIDYSYNQRFGNYP